MSVERNGRQKLPENEARSIAELLSGLEEDADAQWAATEQTKLGFDIETLPVIECGVATQHPLSEPNRFMVNNVGS